jgi:hypothetical protein
MKSWASDLTMYYESVFRSYSGDKLLIVFDIDQTILDTRHAVLDALRAFDSRNGTKYFRDVGISDIDGGEDRLQRLLDRLGLASDERRAVTAEHEQTIRTREAILEGHYRFAGVLDLMRWFQLQPRTDVALVSGRSESSRITTLYQLSVLEKEFCVRFPDEMVYMRPEGPKQSVGEFKVNALTHYRAKGYRIFAVIDSETENLSAMMKSEHEKETLFLHTDRIVKSLQRRVVDRSIRRTFYSEALAPRTAITRPAQFVWDWTDMREDSFFRFLSSNIQWIRADSRFFLDGISRLTFLSARGTTVLDFCCNLLKKHRKKLNIYLPEDGLLLGRIMDLISDYDFEDSDLCFSVANGGPGQPDHRILDVLRTMYPSAYLQFPLHWLAALTLEKPSEAWMVLDSLRGSGVDVFSLDWRTLRRRKVMDQLCAWGFLVDICNANDPRSFMRAAFLHPFSVTSTFSFLNGLGHYGPFYGSGPAAPLITPLMDASEAAILRRAVS